MNTAPKVIGTHVLFFRDGDPYTVPTAGTAGRMFKPAANDPAWIDFGIINVATDAISGEPIDIWAPAPGRKVLFDRIDNKSFNSYKFTLDEVSPVALEILYRTLPLNSGSTQFNQLEGVTKKGWFKLQRYAQGNELLSVLDQFGHVTVEGDTDFGGEGNTKFNMVVTGLHSPYNTGTL